jgi:prophage tail gpP-like protein
MTTIPPRPPAPHAAPTTDDLTLIVAGRRLGGWTDIRVTRGIERVPNDFDIGLTELFPGEAKAVVVQPGDSCQVQIGADTVITGYIDRFMPSLSAGQHSIRVIGRGKTQDLADCAAQWPNSQISGASALAIAQKLAAPYGVPVAAADPQSIGPTIPQFNVMLGETPMEIIERICRYRALLAYEQPDGSLVLSRVGTVSAASGFVEGQNIQSATATFAMDQRFSEYVVFLQSMELLSDLGQGGNLLSTAYDVGVKRHRRRVLIAEAGGGGSDVAKERALWEAARRAGRGSQVEIVTDSWRDRNGRLWTPNTLATVQLPTLKLPQNNWLIGSVTYIRDGYGGTTAALQLMPPEAFLPQPILLQPFPPDVPAGVALLGPQDAPR